MKGYWSLTFLAAVPLFILFQTHSAAPGFPLLNATRKQLTVSIRDLAPLEQNVRQPDMVRIEGGVLERPNHTAGVPSFLISRYETTFAQFDSYCRDLDRPLPPDSGCGRGARPVGCVSWYDAVLFCNWLSRQQGLQPCYTVIKERTDSRNLGSYDLVKWQVSWNRKADGYRLPTEAEWEYAARGGISSRGYTYAGSNEIDDVAWYYDNSCRYPAEVGKKQSNELGLYDMSGNVFEWTWDWYSPGYSSFPSRVIAPAGAADGSTKVVRGGSCFFDYKGAGSSYRKSASPASRVPYIGFRVARGVFLE